MSEPETPQDNPHAMRSDMSDKAFEDRGEIVRSVQVPRDGGDNADATRGGNADADSPAPGGADSD